MLLQGKQPWNRSRGDTCGQETEVPGPTEEDGLVVLDSSFAVGPPEPEVLLKNAN